MLHTPLPGLSGDISSPNSSEVINVPTGIPLAPLMHRAFGREELYGDNCEGEGHGLSSQPQRIASTTTRNPSSPSSQPSMDMLESSTSQKGVARGAEAARRKSRWKKHRSSMRTLRATALPAPAFAYRPQPGAELKASNPIPVEAKLNLKDLPAASGRWVGKNIRPIKSQVWEVGDCIGYGLKELNWDGKKSHALTDDQGRCMATLVGQSDNPSWGAVVAGAGDAMIHARNIGEECGAFKSSDLEHRCGHFAALACGISYGGGQRAPGNLFHSKERRMVLDYLLDNENIQRIAGFQSSAFAYYAPKVYRNYVENLEQLHSHSNDLDINFSNSIFPACTFNLGPNTITYDHTDPGNVAYGMCAITALGDYNPDLGGHLILFDLGLMIRFPPGSTILIPSSILRHGNTPIQSGEQRMSITQYCAGGLFRWVRYGFQTAESLLKQPGGKNRKLELDGDDEEKTTEALNLFSKLPEIDKDRADVFSKRKTLCRR